MKHSVAARHAPPLEPSRAPTASNRRVVRRTAWIVDENRFAMSDGFVLSGQSHAGAKGLTREVHSHSLRRCRSGATHLARARRLAHDREHSRCPQIKFQIHNVLVMLSHYSCFVPAGARSCARLGLTKISHTREMGTTQGDCGR